MQVQVLVLHIVVMQVPEQVPELEQVQVPGRLGQMVVLALLLLALEGSHKSLELAPEETHRSPERQQQVLEQVRALEEHRILLELVLEQVQVQVGEGVLAGSHKRWAAVRGRGVAQAVGGGR